ncbi:hypothetical protein [Metabacillus fastidiosus]|uniref:hypothetical protein n=1 Tax=Metabacillus fastidiosus TaxID=1458 RepID=UPI002E235835|nr:hypothetical protein [Metabacillus fastidiosus]
MQEELSNRQERPEGMPYLHWRVLEAIPQGKENSIPIAYLMEKLAISQLDRRKVNNIINDLINDYNCAIGTSSQKETRGIFLIEDERDLTLSLRTLHTRAISNLDRGRKIVENFNNKYQLNMDLSYSEDTEDFGYLD